MSIIFINPFRFGPPPVSDADAQAYLTAVEAADGQFLEVAVRDAINAFVVGCKSDGIWSAIKASCILAGARTLSGALTPLVGTAPTNVNGNFLTGDYNRETGLMGDGSTKALLTNRLGNSDSQNSQHMAVYVTTRPTGANQQGYIGEASAVGASYIFFNTSNNNLVTSSRTANIEQAVAASTHLGLVGISRSASNTYNRRVSGSSDNVSQTSAASAASPIYVFALGTYAFFHGNPRLAFYSIGESLDLALLDTRVTTLINAIAAAIP